MDARDTYRRSSEASSVPAMRPSQLGAGVRRARGKSRSIARRYGIDPGVAPAFQKSWADRARDRKNRVVQRVLVCCRLAEGSQDRFFEKKKQDNGDAIKRLRAVRKAVAAHAQRVVELGVATRRFAGNASSIVCESESLLGPSAEFATASKQLETQSYRFLAKVTSTVLEKFDHRIENLDRIQAMMIERSNLLVDVDYAKRKVLVEQQRGNVNRVADRKRNLEIAQLHYKRATQEVTDRLTDVDSSTDTLVLALLNEYALVLQDHFAASADTMLSVEESPPSTQPSSQPSSQPSTQPSTQSMHVAYKLL